MDELKEAHRTAHSGQKHVRAGWKALTTALDRRSSPPLVSLPLPLAGEGCGSTLPEQRLADIGAGGTDRIPLGIAVGDPLLPAERHHGNPFDVGPHDVGLPDVVGEAIVIAVGGRRCRPGSRWWSRRMGPLSHLLRTAGRGLSPDGSFWPWTASPRTSPGRARRFARSRWEHWPMATENWLRSGRSRIPSPTDLCWEIGSITKVFTGILLAEMAERGEVASRRSARALRPR